MWIPPVKLLRALLACMYGLLPSHFHLKFCSKYAKTGRVRNTEAVKAWERGYASYFTMKLRFRS